MRAVWVAVDPQPSYLARLPIAHNNIIVMIMINKHSCIAGSTERPTENIKACLDSDGCDYTIAPKPTKQLQGEQQKGIIT